MALLHTLIAAATLTLAGSAFAAGNHQHGDDHQPRHGGVVAATKQMDFELVARPGTLQLYLRDHGKPADASRASARLTLLSGADKQEVELQPAGGELEASGSFKVGPGTKVVAVVSLAGKPLGSARFVLK